MICNSFLPWWFDLNDLLEDESDGEWNSGRENSGWMTGSCTAKNSRTTWIRGCPGTSWKTWGHKTKYSRTNTVKGKVHGKTKYSRTNWVKKNSWQFAINILCNVFDFLFENLSLNKMYNVFSSCWTSDIVRPENTNVRSILRLVGHFVWQIFCQLKTGFVLLFVYGFLIFD